MILYITKHIRQTIIKSCLLCIAILLCGQAYSQDFHFTQFYANKLYLAPSFAGATAENRVIGNYRNQWLGLSDGKAYVTYSTSFDHYFSNFNSGLGLLVMRDVAGSMNMGRLNIGLAYSFDFMINDEIHVRPGASFSYIQNSIDPSKANFGDDVPPTEVLNGNFKIGGVDASSSAIVYNKDAWFGLTIDHLLHPNISYIQNNDKFPLKESLFGGYTILRKGRLLRPIDETVSIAFLFSNADKLNLLDMGLYWAKSPLTFGVWYRGIPILDGKGDSFSVLIGTKVQHFSLGYSYDFTISSLGNSTSGTHEISISYEFSTVKRKRMQAVPCPEF